MSDISATLALASTLGLEVAQLRAFSEAEEIGLGLLYGGRGGNLLASQEWEEDDNGVPVGTPHSITLWVADSDFEEAFRLLGW